MEDTVVLRIHNLAKYRMLYEQFQQSNKSKNIIVEGTAVIDEDGVITEGHKIWQRIKAFEDSGKFLPHVYSFDINAPSSVYHVRGFIRNMGSPKMFLEIEFSLPKYFYATNVFQLLGTPAQSSEANFYMLLKAIKRFMKDFFMQIPRDEDIELFRLDLCYNQFHKSKTDALHFLGAQREWMKRYCDGKNMRLVDSYATTWTVLTSRYSFKCYHKGTEFNENDYPHLVKNLSKHGYNLGKLQEYSDLILRYEITYRRTMMHYLTMYYTFQDLERKAAFMLNSPMYDYLKRLQKRGSFAETSHAAKVNGKGLTPIEFFASKQKKFCLKSDFDKAYNPMCVFSESVTFNYKVYKLLFEWFWSKIRIAQPDEEMPIFKMVERINGYQEKLVGRKQKGGYSKSQVKKGNLRAVGKKNEARLLVPALLSQFMDLRVLKQYLPEATYYRLQRDFKEIGLPMKSMMAVSSKPPLDYADNAALLEPMKKKNFIL